MDKIEKLKKIIENIDTWWTKKAKPQIVRFDAPKEYMEGRIVFCANCGINVYVWRYQGSLRCSTCNSHNWEFPITIRPAIDKDILRKVLAKSVGKPRHIPLKEN